MNTHNKIIERRRGKGTYQVTTTTPVAQHNFKFQNEAPRTQRKEPDPALLQKIEYYNDIYSIKPTSTKVPDSISTFQRTNVPVGMIVQPFMNIEPQRYIDNTPMRCEECHCFLNPFWEFLGKGDRARCNLCNHVNVVPNEKYMPLNEYMVPTNFEERPELITGVYEMKVGEDFANKTPSDPSYLFIIDVTPKAIQTGATHAMLSCIQSAVNDNLLNGGVNAQIGIVCFDSKIHLVSMDSTTKKPIITSMVGSFQTCPFPLSHLTFCSDDLIGEGGDSIISAIADAFDPAKEVGDTIPVRSLLILGNILMKNNGGKVSLMLANDHTNWGDSLSYKSVSDPLTGERNKYVPSNSFFTQSGSSLAVNQISFDLYIFGKAKFHNLATFCDFQKSLGGTTYYYETDDVEACIIQSYSSKPIQ